MTNSLEQYSLPLKTQETKLAIIYFLNSRDSKKGRLFTPIYDHRHPFKFEVKYSYYSKFLEKDNTAGNHYHNKKQEILIPIAGTFDITLEDIETKEKETFSLDANNNQAIYIRTKISHKVTSKQETGVMLVFASHPSSLDDEIVYNV